MNNKIRPADNISRTYSRGLVLTTLEMEVILIGIKVVGSGYIVVETKTWDQYWNPLCGLQIGGLKQHLNAFHVAWRSYIKSGFHASKQQEYCFRYFRLLNVLLAGHQSKTHSNLLKKALRTVLGFECFGVSTNNSDVVAAGTTTLRNPCYLLAKLKMPDAIDDTQFLPIITLEHTERPELFYHYRQHSLSLDSSIALLLYVAVSREIRSSSFKTISTFVGRITYGVDPRGHERARRLGRAIVRPIIEEHKTGHMLHLEFVDIGAGSGHLLSSLCRQVLTLGASMGFTPKFQLWSLDLESKDPVRFFRATRMNNLLDSLAFVGSDYKDWLNRAQPLPAAIGPRIAWMSRLLNNLSLFIIRPVSRDEILHSGHAIPTSMYQPSVCLDATQNRPEELAISNTRVELTDGRTYLQPSLSDFNRGLHSLTATTGHAKGGSDCLYLPVRTFSPDCLVTTGGDSVISRLLDMCEYLIIEDSDLKEADLVDHLELFSLQSVEAQNMTKPMRLVGNHAYALWSTIKVKSAPAFSGERIW